MAPSPLLTSLLEGAQAWRFQKQLFPFLCTVFCLLDLEDLNLKEAGPWLIREAAPTGHSGPVQPPEALPLHQPRCQAPSPLTLSSLLELPYCTWNTAKLTFVASKTLCVGCLPSLKISVSLFFSYFFVF